MKFTEQQTLSFKKLLKELNFTQKALIAQLNKEGFQFDQTVLSNALNQRRGLPDSYVKGIKEYLAILIRQLSPTKQVALSLQLEQVFTEDVGDSFESLAVKPMEPQIPQNLVFTCAGEPLPANSAHYIRRPCDGEFDDYLQQNRQLILLTGAPKYGITSLYNRAEKKLVALGKQVLRINMLAVAEELMQLKICLRSKAFGIQTLGALLVFAIAKQLEKTAEIDIEMNRLLDLPDRFSLIQKEIASVVTLLLSDSTPYTLVIDDLDKLLYQEKIDLVTQTDFVFLLKDTIASPRVQVICALAPFIWFQDQHTSQVLRQAAEQETTPLDLFRVEQLYQQIASHNNACFAEFGNQQTTIIQRITDNLGGSPFLMHWLFEQVECQSLNEAFDKLVTHFAEIPELLTYKQQLLALANVIKKHHIPLTTDTDLQQQPLEINRLLAKCRLVNIQNTELNALFSLAISVD